MLPQWFFPRQHFLTSSGSISELLIKLYMPHFHFSIRGKQHIAFLAVKFRKFRSPVEKNVAEDVIDTGG